MIKASYKLKKRDINFILVSMLSISTIIPYIPNISRFNVLQYLFFLLILIINIKNIINITIKRYNKMLILLLTLSIYYGLAIIVDNNTNYSDLKIIILSLGIYILLNSIKIDNYKKSKVIYLTSIIYIISSFYTIYTIKGNLSINLGNEPYFYGSKNGLGPILSISGIYLLYKYLFINGKKVDVLMYILSIWALCILQTRTAILGILLGSIVLLGYKFMNKNSIKFTIKCIVIFIILTIVILFIGEEMVYLISKILRIEKSSTISSISSGRDLAINYGMQFFKDNPLFGVLYNKNITHAYGSIHNLWLRSLIYGGIIYFLIIITYIYNLFKVIYINYCSDKVLLYSLIAQIIVSTLFEPVAPFGPGTTYFLFWLIIAFNVQFDNYDAEEIL